LSVPTGVLYVTTALHKPEPLLTVTEAGQLMVGDSLLSTVTLNAQVAELPHASVAMAVTVEVPTGKKEPEAGLYVTLGDAVQLSVAVVVPKSP